MGSFPPTNTSPRAAVLNEDSVSDISADFTDFM